MWRSIFIVANIFSFFLLSVISFTPAMAANARFDVNKMGDMSGFDPSHPVIPTGDTIKIAVLGSFSGPGSGLGEQYFTMVQWVAHDYNKRGGILVDGKKKLVQVFKADHMSRPDQCKKICEQMALQEKVHVLWGTNGGNLVKIMNQTADKYHIISQNMASLSDELMDATNFFRYAFMTMYSTSQVGKGFAYYYGKIKKKEKKFYIICQDYMFGHDLAEEFKKGLKEYYPEAQIVGEDYH
jgi:ABC-type branched-subunit amino acid transport system substrate-binding protein